MSDTEEKLQQEQQQEQENQQQEQQDSQQNENNNENSQQQQDDQQQVEQNTEQQQEEQQQEEQVQKEVEQGQQEEQNQEQQQQQQQQQEQVQEQEQIQDQPQQQEQVQQQEQQYSEIGNQNIKSICVKRKIDCFQLLRDWDTKRTQFLQHHQQIVQRIQQEVTQKIQFSAWYINLVMDFLDTRAKQESAYANFPNPQIEEGLQNSEIMQKLYGKQNSHLFKVQKAHHERAQKSAELSKYIWEEILNKQMVTFNAEAKKAYDEIYHIIDVMNKSLRKNHQTASKKSTKVSSIYQAQQQEKSILNTKHDKDLYKSLLGFLRICESQRDNQRNLAKHTLKLYQRAKQLEYKRQVLIQDAIFEYQQAYEKCYGQQDNFEQFSLGEEYGKTIEEVFDIQQILGESYIGFLKTQLNISNEEGNDLSFEQVEKFLIDFQIQPFEENVLVLKSLHIKKEILPNQFTDVKMTLTVDGYLHCVDLEDREDKPQEYQGKYKKSVYLQKLHKPQFKKITDVVIEIRNKENLFGKIFDGGNRIKFKFNSEEEIEELYRIATNF